MNTNMNTPAAANVVDDLAALVARLAHSVRSESPSSFDIANSAIDYLLRHGLAGSPLRDTPAAAPQDERAPFEAWAHEPMVRYCPGCGSVGTVDAKYRDCCPDGDEARMIPQSLAEKCQRTFKLAIGKALADGQPADARDAARYRWLRGRALDSITQGGVFAGMTPKNVVLNGVDLDATIDAARALQGEGA